MAVVGDLFGFDFYYSSIDTDHFYTAFIAGEITQGVYAFISNNVWYLWGSQKSGTVPVYRYYSPSLKDHYYTTAGGSYTNYISEGVVGYAWPGPGPNRVAITGWYNSSVQDHAYTTGGSPGGGFVSEGIAWYSPIPVFGCKDINAANYNSEVNQPSSGCIYPSINSFIATPNPQTSGNDGIPNYDVTLSWNTSGVTQVTLDGTVVSSSTGLTNLNGDAVRTNLPQSSVGSNSPASRTYTLTATGGNITKTSTVTVQVYNDNTPRNFTIPDQNNVEPNTLIVISVGQILDIDMVTAAIGGPGVQVSANGSSWSGTIFVSNGNNLFVRVTSLPFNTNPSGLTNSTQFYVDVGTIRRYFTVTTRAPIVQEIFNYANYNNKVPFPDIDTIENSPDHPAKPFIETSSLTMDDIELTNPFGVEIKTSNSNVQVRKKIAGSSLYTDWQDLRSI